MAKLLPMMLFIVAINLSIVVFIGADVPGSSLWDLITNPQNWGNLTLIGLLDDAILLSSVVGIVVGSFWTKSDFLIFASITGVFLSFGISFAELYTRFNQWEVLGQSNSYIALILAAPLILTYIYTILLFWRGQG